MEEKLIYEGRLHANPQDIQAVIDKFMLDNLISPLDIDININKVENKQIWITFPQPLGDSPMNVIFNGYVEFDSESGISDEPIELRIVSCRPELDLLYFQLSQLIQARFLLPNYPPELLVIPWQELLQKGMITPGKESMEDLLSQLPDPDDTIKKYGTEGKLTRNDVRRHVAACREFLGHNGTIKEYHNNLGGNPPFAFETFRDYMKNPDFAPSQEPK